MKAKYIFTILIASALSFTSCLGDLDVKPLDPNIVTGDDVYTDVASYTKGLMKIYSVWAISGQEGEGSSDIEGLDAGNAQLLRSYFNLQVVTTDESKSAWGDSWVPEINNMQWSNVKNESIEGVYQRCMFVVALSNEFIRQLDKSTIEGRDQMKAEARFSRALAYYTLLDLFGNPPFVTEDNFSLEPPALPRAELFAWVEKELKEIKSELPQARTGIYGRADQGVVNFLLARLYLNAKEFAGKEMYTECITAVKDVIAGGYGLSNIYANLFKADNGQNALTNREIIFPICFDGASTKTWGGMTYFIAASRSGSEWEADYARGGLKSGWDGIRTTEKIVDLFEYADPANKTSENILDKRGIFKSEGRTIGIKQTNGTFTSEGWGVYKYSNVKSDGTYCDNHEFPETDFPMFRLADAYLMYAEAVLRGGQGGDRATALGYVNELRDRAYGNQLGRITAAELTLDFILDERGRELYWEATRRTDLIRYDKYTSGSYVWPFKGGVASGVAVESFKNLFPIPLTDLSVNGNLEQNPGYGK